MRTLLLTLAMACAAAPAAHAQSLGESLSPPAEVPSNTGEREEPAWVAPPAARYGQQEAVGTPPDLVLTHGGGMIRGTILRSLPGREVVIRLETGELQTVAWAEVHFAGRAVEAPPSPPSFSRLPSTISPEPPGSPSGVRVRFESEQRVTIHAQTATAHGTASAGTIQVHSRAHLYEQLCTAPCEFRIDPGVHRLALSWGEREPLAGPVLDIRGSGTLHGRYVENGSLRAGGWAAFILGLLGAGGAVTAISLLPTYDLFEPLIITAGLNVLVAFFAGLPRAAAGRARAAGR